MTKAFSHMYTIRMATQRWTHRHVYKLRGTQKVARLTWERQVLPNASCQSLSPVFSTPDFHASAHQSVSVNQQEESILTISSHTSPENKQSKTTLGWVGIKTTCCGAFTPGDTVLPNCHILGDGLAPVLQFKRVFSPSSKNSGRL